VDLEKGSTTEFRRNKAEPEPTASKNHETTESRGRTKPTSRIEKKNEKKRH